MEDNEKDNLEDPEGVSAGNDWPALLMECVLQVWPELNTSNTLPVPLHTLSNATHALYLDQDFYRGLLNLSEPGEVNGTEWDSGGKERLEQCLESPPTDRPYLLPWWQQLTWTLAFGAMLLVAVGGNAIVMWIVIGEGSKC